MSAASRLTELVGTISKSGDPDRNFFYLGGPMTGIPAFNFPRFKEVAATLRCNGYNIISPAEIDTPEIEELALASVDGAPGSGDLNGVGYMDFLARDLTIACMPTCVGGIFMEGWEDSRGACMEQDILTKLEKQVFEFRETGGALGLPVLQGLFHPEEDKTLAAA